jgi:hypothetical protein
MTRKLPLTQSARERLELPTIMDRALAAAHGSAYVQLAAFAIDVDRVFVELEGEPELPFGWEVLLTECYLVARIDPHEAAQRVLLEDTCLAILEQPAEEQGYGSQLLFAVYDAIDRGLFPQALHAMFQSWRKKPRQLRKALDALWQTRAKVLAACAARCLATELEPELAPSTREVLEAMQAGRWMVPDE